MIDRPRPVIKKFFISKNIKKNSLVVALQKNKIKSLVINNIAQRGFLGSNAKIYIIDKKSYELFQMPTNKHEENEDKGLNFEAKTFLYYVYAVLNDDTFQKQFSQAITFESKIHIPSYNHWQKKTDFKKLVNIGHKLTQLHLNYETATPCQDVQIRVYQAKKEIKFKDYSLTEFLTEIVKPLSREERYKLFRIKKIKFDEEKKVLIFNEKLKIYNISPTVYKWKIRENKSPLE